MTTKSILTNGFNVQAVGSAYYAPVAVIPTAVNSPIYSTYCFMGKVGPWANDADPPAPTQDVAYIKSVFKRIFAVKKVGTNNISPVIQRINWSANTVYDYYQDNVDMTAKDINDNLVYKFYIKNKYDQVFKCLWNNNGGLATDEPYFEPGTYNSENIYLGSDGYKWKFMYVIDSGKKNAFMDSDWMPVSINEVAPNPLDSKYGYGSIEVINLTNSGNNYNEALSPITISIVGDGTGATAIPITTNNILTDILVTNPGANYTYANAYIVSSGGSGAVAIAPTSPVGGHAYDPVTELGCSHVMYSVEFNGSEGGVIPVGTPTNPVDFHQVGLMINPVDLNSTPIPANGAIYRTTTDIYVAAGSGTYQNDDIVFQSPDRTLANATFKGTVLYFDDTINLLYVLNTNGTLTLNASLYSNTATATRTVLSYNNPNFELLSGTITYLENISSVQRSSDGIEQFRFVLAFK